MVVVLVVPVVVRAAEPELPVVLAAAVGLAAVVVKAYGPPNVWTLSEINLVSLKGPSSDLGTASARPPLEC